MASPAAEVTQAQPVTVADQTGTPPADDGQSRRPRDARLIHLVLSSLGVHNYQERVPLQLLDFAYRYTSSVLSDSIRLSAEGYTAAPGTTSKRAADAAGGGDGSNITVTALRQAIASRQDYTFQGPALPKDWLMDQASERNRVMLPKAERAWGVQLPPQKYCLTGTGWNLKEEWDSEDDEEGKEKDASKEQTNGDGDKQMGGVDEEGTEEVEGDTFEDVFGKDSDREMDDA